MNKYLVSSLILLSLFVILSIQIRDNLDDKTIGNSNIINDLDAVTKHFPNVFASPMLNQIFAFLSEYGREYFWISILIIMFLFGRKDGKIVALILLVSFTIIIPLNITIKDLVGRDRPLVHDEEYANNTLIPPPDKSYPSGHASLVSAGAVAVLLFFNCTRSQKLISLLLVVEAGMVCVSRLYLGVHYPSDVVAGILLGSGISLLVASNHKMLEKLVNISIMHKQ